jgi:hypothetical protein
MSNTVFCWVEVCNQLGERTEAEDPIRNLLTGAFARKK